METAGWQHQEAGGSTCCGHYIHSTTPALAYKAPSPEQRKHIMPPLDHLDVLPIHMQWSLKRQLAGSGKPVAATHII